MSKEISAVEWLCNEWLYIDQEFDMNLINKKIYWERLKSVQEQAKEMEKQQIVDSFEKGYENGAGVSDEDPIYHGGNYYNKTFKSK